MEALNHELRLRCMLVCLTSIHCKRSSMIDQKAPLFSTSIGGFPNLGRFMSEDREVLARLPYSVLGTRH